MSDKRKDMVKRFERGVRAFVRAHELLHSGAPVIVALSGGADSVALLAALSHLGYYCIAAHCNFHLRGPESRRDMLHAQAIASRFGVDFSLRDFDVPARMAATGESVEMACRSLRYDWFSSLADSSGAQAIAVGHHSEDRAETFVLNLMRGAGIRGLTSMRPRNGAVVRPLLWASRGEIEEYLEAQEIEFVSDSSNASDAHRRNRVRNTLLPALEEMFPGATQSILRSIANLESARAIYEDAVEGKRRQYVGSDGSISLAELSAENEAPTLLFEFLRERGFNATQVSDMLANASGSGAKFQSAEGRLAEIDHGTLRITEGTGSRAADREYPVSLQRDILYPTNIRVTRHPVEHFKPEGRNPNVAFIDARFAAAEGFSWTLRHWRRGDRMTPFGARADKLVSDIFADAHLSPAAKRQTWLLVCNGTIAWIPGLRNGAFASVGPDSTGYLRLEYLPNHPTSADNNQ